jgi:hypothetical protein
LVFLDLKQPVEKEVVSHVLPDPGDLSVFRTHQKIVRRTE